MIDKVYRYGFFLSVLIVAIVIYLYDRQSNRFAELLFNLQKEALENKLKAAKEKLSEETSMYEKNLKKYTDLKRQFAADIERLRPEY